ncbi:MAG: flavin monoamine oxidase family protein [Terriglobales bacterium]
MDAEVIVIGGGVAGLAAWQRLRAAGCAAVLVEARGRLGGRVWTQHPPGWPLPVELGAEFIHAGAPELDAFAGDADRRSTRAWTAAGGRLRGAGEFAGGAGAVFERMRAIRPPVPDLSFAAFLEQYCADLPAAARAAARGYIEGYEAADSARIGVYGLNREQQAESENRDASPALPRRPRGGYDSLLRHLGAADLAEHIWLNTAVCRVRWRRGRVTVEARMGGAPVRLTARAAVITLPLGVLQRGSVVFDPPLAAKRAALKMLVSGGALRLTLRLREPIWRRLRDSEGRPMAELGFLFGQSRASGHFPTWWASQAPGGAQITGWAAGRHAWALAGRPPAFLLQRGLADLSRRLGVRVGKLRALVLEPHTHDWQRDPLSLGAYSYAAVGGADAFAPVAAPLSQTLFFAGEATEATGHHATVHGALRSGLRAAEEVLSR